MRNKQRITSVILHLRSMYVSWHYLINNR